MPWQSWTALRRKMLTVEESAQISAMVKHRAGRLEDAVTVLH